MRSQIAHSKWGLGKIVSDVKQDPREISPLPSMNYNSQS